MDDDDDDDDDGGGDDDDDDNDDGKGFDTFLAPLLSFVGFVHIG